MLKKQAFLYWLHTLYWMIKLHTPERLNQYSYDVCDDKPDSCYDTGNHYEDKII